MKRLMLMLPLIVSCDFVQEIIDAPSKIGKAILRVEENSDEAQDQSINKLEKDVSSLEEQLKALNELFESQNAVNELRFSAIENDFITFGIDFQALLDSLDSEIETLKQKVSYYNQETQLQIDELQDAIELLQELSENSIVEVVDPCGDNPGKFDEVLIVLNSGDIIGYFEDGGKRFLTVLKAGKYQTTDEQKCKFTIEGGEVI